MGAIGLLDEEVISYGLGRYFVRTALREKTKRRIVHCILQASVARYMSRSSSSLASLSLCGPSTSTEYHHNSKDSMTFLTKI